MAGEQVAAAVRNALDARQLQLSDAATAELLMRVAEADESALGTVVEEVGVAVIARADAVAVVDESVERLAMVLRRTGEGPYTADEVATALAGLCPIWPFC